MSPSTIYIDIENVLILWRKSGVRHCFFVLFYFHTHILGNKSDVVVTESLLTSILCRTKGTSPCCLLSSLCLLAYAFFALPQPLLLLTISKKNERPGASKKLFNTMSCVLSLHHSSSNVTRCYLLHALCINCDSTLFLT